jgi:hypothetical protein
MRIVIKPQTYLPRSPHRTKGGLTLAEVMISMVILAFSALGLTRLLYQIRVTAEDNVHQQTAIVMAQGYLEQLCRLPYANPGPYNGSNIAGVLNIADDTTGATVPITMINSSGLPVTNQSGGNFGNGKTSSENIFLDQDASGNPIMKMQFQFTPVLTDLGVTSGGTASGVEITVNFTVTYSYGNTRTFSSSVRTVRSAVPVM